MTTVKPNLKKPGSVFELINEAQAALRLSDKDIAENLGCEKSVVTQILKTGKMRLPIKHVPLLAELLDLEPGVLMRKVLKEISPDVLQAIESCLGPFDLSPTETHIITVMRKSSGGRDMATVHFGKESIIAVIVA